MQISLSLQKIIKTKTNKLYTMKNMFRKIFYTLMLSLPLFMNSVLADPPGPPNPGGNPAGNGGVPVGAPIDNGIFVLLALAIGYGAYKIYEIRKAKLKAADDSIK